VRESGLYEVQITVMTAFPGTPLLARLQQEGRVLRENAWDLCTLFDVNFRPRHMTAAELEVNFRRLSAALYSHEETSRRRRDFFRDLRRSPNRKAAVRRIADAVPA
jgi:hypothetical protein